MAVVLCSPAREKAMTRTTIMLPEELKVRAQEKAREVGISLGELLRESLELRLGVPGDRLEDPLFSNVPVYDGPAPEDLSEEHDRYLYGDRD
jgi:hypothetical protein